MKAIRRNLRYQNEPTVEIDDSQAVVKAVSIRSVRHCTMLLSGENLHCHACFNTRRSYTRPSIARHPVTCSANGSSKQTTIHKLIDQQKTLLIPGVHDALSAKVLAHTGHVSAFVSGYAVSMHEACTCLGSPSALFGTRCTSSEQQDFQALIPASVGSAFAQVTAW